MRGAAEEQHRYTVVIVAHNYKGVGKKLCLEFFKKQMSSTQVLQYQMRSLRSSSGSGWPEATSW